MGKDNKKKSKNEPSFFEYYTRSGKVGEALDRYDIETIHYGHPDNRSVKPNRTREQVSEELADAAMKDYDTRRTMEAAALAGEKGAKKFAKKGYKDATDVIDAQDFFKKYRDSGGSFSSNADYAGLTHKAVKAERDQFGSQFASIADLEALKEKMTQDANNKATEPQGPIEHSSEMSAANASVGNNHAVPKADTAGEAAKLFSHDYKLDVSAGARIAEEKQLNLENAKMAMRR